MSAGPIRVFCGAARDARLPFQVLCHSIRTRTARPVEIRTIDNALAPAVRDARHTPYTEFSFARFAIPELCEYRGRAVYMDSDMLVLADMAELWEQPFDGAKALIEVGARRAKDRGKHAAVMLLDCARLDWKTSDIVAGLGVRYTYDELMSLDPLLGPDELVERIPAGWNELDAFDPARTRNVHYTDIRTQPWVSAEHPCGRLWIEELERALAEGSVSEETVREEAAAGYARPSLLVELGLESGPDPRDPSALAAWDRARGHRPQRELLARFAARRRAIHAFERDCAIARRPWLAPWYRLAFAVRNRARG